MNIEHIIGSVIKGALTGKRKRGRGATRYLSGGKGSFLNSSTLLAMAGVAWGIYETVANKAPVHAAGGVGPPGVAPATAGTPHASPLTSAGPTAPPPLPVTASAGPPAPAVADVPEAVVRLVRVAISAARADGTLTPQEESVILEHSREAGAEAIVERELRSSFTLAQITAGVTDVTQREELYTLAFAIARGDEQITGGERIYLAQLAHQLGLDPEAVARLEQDAAARIDAAAAEPEEGPARA